MQSNPTQSLSQRAHMFVMGLCILATAALSACGGGGGGSTSASSIASPSTSNSTPAANPYPGVAASTSLDLNSPLNYASPSLLAHYDASVLATSNQAAANNTTNKGVIAKITTSGTNTTCKSPAPWSCIQSSMACNTCHESSKARTRVIKRFGIAIESNDAQMRESL